MASAAVVLAAFIIATIRPTTVLLLALLLALASSYQYMNKIRTFFSATASHSMPKGPQAPPAPTIPIAIKARQEIEAGKLGEGVEYATFASGCFWGTEHLFTKHYSHLPKFSAESGYTGGQEGGKEPTYREVCSGSTGHAEAVRVGYQKGSVAYAELVEFFYRTHESHTENRQGPDRGSQYRSAIFYESPEQKQIAEQATQEVQDLHLKGKPIVTRIVPMTKWYKAEPYHQDYLNLNPGGYECPTHRFFW